MLQVRKPLPAGGSPFCTEDAALAYKHFLPRVAMIPVERIEACRVEPALVRASVQRSVDSISPHQSQIREELPRVSLRELLELPALALGLVFAAGRVAGPPTSKEVAGLLVIRDRFWTALSERYTTLRRVGVYLFGEDDVDARIPPLKARIVSSSVSSLSTMSPASPRAPISARAPISVSGPISAPASTS